MRLTRTGLAAFGAVAVLGAGIAIPAMAQDDSATDTGETAAEVAPPGRFAERFEERHAELAELLAAELDGVTAEEIAAALDTVREARWAERHAERTAAFEERLADAVEAGDLTEEQAEALREAHEAGTFQGLGGPRRGGHGPGSGRGSGPGPFYPPTDDAA